MANQSTGNPIVVDTPGATAIYTGVKLLRLVQWVDDNQDITDGSNLIMTINGSTIEATVQRPTDVGFATAVFWQIGPFNPAIPVTGISIPTLSAGNVIIWLD